MLSDCKGFTLIDALLGVSILTVFLTIALPSVNDLIKERKYVTEKMYVLTTLHNDLQYWLYGDYNNLESTTILETPFNKELYVTRNKNNRKVEVCIAWNITEIRKEELCLYGHTTK